MYIISWQNWFSGLSWIYANCMCAIYASWNLIYFDLYFCYSCCCMGCRGASEDWRSGSGSSTGNVSENQSALYCLVSYRPLFLGSKGMLWIIIIKHQVSGKQTYAMNALGQAVFFCENNKLKFIGHKIMHRHTFLYAHLLICAAIIITCIHLFTYQNELCCKNIFNDLLVNECGTC